MASILILGTPDLALADTSGATGQAATVQLLGQPAVSTGQVAASNDGISQTKTGNSTPSLSILGVQTILSDGSLFQDAVANNDGTSAACAGIIGANGAIQIGPSQSCLVSGAPSGVVLNLGLAVLRADVITAECTASSNGTTTGSATLANARITDPTGSITLLSLPINPAPNTGLSLPGIVDLILNKQSSGGPGQLSVTALDLNVLGGLNLARVQLGIVTCGPNAQTGPIPLLSSAGLPVAGGTVLASASVFWFIRRRRASTPTNA
ncbi:MAG: choice-of-anchor P family protein [Acidimicrobiales bacterium]|nr:hypothetical protein [Actinomycetota bacterium]